MDQDDQDADQDDFVEQFCNSPYTPKQTRRSRKTTPHAALKHKCRNAMATWKREHGCSAVLRKSYVGKATSSSGREIVLGTRGESDDCYIIGKDGKLWGVIAPEYKAGNDRQSDVQRLYEEKCRRAGVIYVLCRQPADIIAALDKLAIDAGWRPF